MILKGCTVSNFGSYRSLKFDFQDQGLALIQGPTGSGKSTICDIACWALYGITAKDGSVDEVRSWLSEDTTEVALTVGLDDGEVVVTRVRGRSSQNDLFWEDGNGTLHRGKDVTDTQRLLNERLGVDPDLYLLAAYYSEFSPSASFFSAKAKDRRALLERLAPLALPARLASAASEERKDAKKWLQDAQRVHDKNTAIFAQMHKALEGALEYSSAWVAKQDARIAELTAKRADFENIKASKIASAKTQALRFDQLRTERMAKLRLRRDKLEANISPLEDFDAAISTALAMSSGAEGRPCPACGVTKPTDQALGAAKDVADLRVARAETVGIMNELIRIEQEHEALLTHENPHAPAVAAAEALENHFGTELESERRKISPFTQQVKKYKEDVLAAEREVGVSSIRVTELNQDISALTKLYELSGVLRGELLKKTVRELEALTNAWLEQYLDSEIRVEFQMTSGDELDVSLTKSGHQCSYRQLSKGQRQLLKLTFWLASSAIAANTAGVHFDNLFLDEALDGLDDALKVKAFSMFEMLSNSHNSVIFIDHTEAVKLLCGKRYNVVMEGDESIIKEEA